jgi:hypothetical protein
MIINAMRWLFGAAEIESGTPAALDLFEANGCARALTDAEEAALSDERVVGPWQLWNKVMQHARDPGQLEA